MYQEEYEASDYTYAVYARKSSETEDRQVQSIDRQLEELNEIIDHEGLIVHKEVFTEKQSAFSPGREHFRRMVELTENGTVNAWMCWHVNRLSRNPRDAGEVLYLMDQGKLHHVRTKDKIYFNTPSDKLMLNIELTFSKKDSDDKSIMVRSGMDRRHRRGYPNGFPPVGYRLGDQGIKGASYWEADPERFEMVRTLFRSYLKGIHSITSLHELSCELGLTSIRRKKVGGVSIPRSSIYKHVLKNPVYAGFFYGHDGKRYELAPDVPRMITEVEFQRIGEMLGGNSTPRTGRKAAYAGIVKGINGEHIGADFKFQVVCDCGQKFSYINRDSCPRCHTKIVNMRCPQYRSYTYYYAPERKLDKNQRVRYVEERKVDRFLSEFVATRMKISPELRDWAITYLEELKDKGLSDQRRIYLKQKSLEQELVGRRRRLKDLYLAGEMDVEEYRADLKHLEASYGGAIQKEEATQCKGDWLKHAKEILNLAADFEQVMQNGDVAEKHQALGLFTSNLFWDGEKLVIHMDGLVKILVSTLDAATSENPDFEPSTCGSTEPSNPDFEKVRPVLLRGLNAFRTFYE